MFRPIIRSVLSVNRKIVVAGNNTINNSSIFLPFVSVVNGSTSAAFPSSTTSATTTRSASNGTQSMNSASSHTNTRDLITWNQKKLYEEWGRGLITSKKSKSKSEQSTSRFNDKPLLDSAAEWSESKSSNKPLLDTDADSISAISLDILEHRREATDENQYPTIAAAVSSSSVSAVETYDDTRRRRILSDRFTTTFDVYDDEYEVIQVKEGKDITRTTGTIQMRDPKPSSYSANGLLQMRKLERVSEQEQQKKELEEAMQIEQERLAVIEHDRLVAKKRKNAAGTETDVEIEKVNEVQDDGTTSALSFFNQYGPSPAGYTIFFLIIYGMME
mmetsp:Transcript_43432/g.49163  ORF Transcript_43432/g.49163 Transcript_43432/m.49163 type:complete len:331 (+) Transcript_43432:218-1210(+)|eukprot:CAMPEP_0170928726 /NCGR_PEP_ID=MMETSP0735-20130129/14356_1 /TAXON_ID=186038 /ORGANISM="Fragilariopsis kerguelensis, Strain L26-C5" /LENGTH=330 /DNA_ID=CAMNT_0011329663 /DNA_START=143 /DNA_END=1135 /DNA_ORIENTATION=-